MTDRAKDIIGGVRESWQFRAEQLTRGNETAVGMILLAVLNRRPHKPPAVGHKAIIGSNSRVYASYMHRNGRVEHYVPICTVADLTTMFRRLADALKLDDADRVAMFNEVKKWIVKDYRAKSDENLF